MNEASHHHTVLAGGVWYSINASYTCTLVYSKAPIVDTPTWGHNILNLSTKHALYGPKQYLFSYSSNYNYYELPRRGQLLYKGQSHLIYIHSFQGVDFRKFDCFYAYIVSA